MRKFLFPILILLTIISCGKKKQVLDSGSIGENGTSEVTFEVFINNDSAFEAYTDVASGRIWKMKRAKDEKALRDSTYSLNVYFIPSGKLQAQKQYTLKKPVGSWKTFYESGNIESETKYENGLLLGYETRFPSGKLQVKGELLPDSTFRHREYFENDVPKREMVTDKNGNGSCTYWYPNKRMKSTGPITDFAPSGIWKGWDTAGIAAPDQLIGIPRK